MLSAEPLILKEIDGQIQELVESEWEIPAMEALKPIRAPENVSTLLAAADEEESCQLPVTEIVSARVSEDAQLALQPVTTIEARTPPRKMQESGRSAYMGETSGANGKEWKEHPVPPTNL